ncbi:MAG TPA: lytic transglycosylase domain-containing protein [Thermoanaerobaculia bacterium]|nr:lytic transglycosylase domain-containing protein [Thermoanaerobaculia bacterium]
MSSRRHRASVVCAATLLFLVVTFISSPSDPATPGPQPPAPRVEEIHALEELAGWVAGERNLIVFTPGDVASALRDGRRGFELFRSYTAHEARRGFVEKLPYGRLIFGAAERHGVDSLLVAAVVEAESGFRSEATSPKGALGLMQVMPATGELYGVVDLMDPVGNLEVGTRYVRDLLEIYDGDLELALAAYNAGPGNVKRFGGMPPFAETRGYVTRVLDRYVRHHRRVWDASGAADQVLLR